MSATVLELPDRAVVTEAESWPARARAAQITDTASYAGACELLLGIKDLRRKIAETFDPHVQRACDAHRALVKEKRDAEAPLTEAETIVKGAIAAYDQEQERLLREAQRRLDEEARKKAEDDRLALAAAMELEGKLYGDDALVDEAHALIEAPITPVPVAPAPRTTPKVAGVSIRTTYAAEVVDLRALVTFVAANPSHLNLLSANMPALNAQARSLQAAMHIPGVRVVPTQSVAAGRR